MTDFLKKLCSTLVSCGVSRNIPLGTILGSLVFLPLLACFHLVHYFVPVIFWPLIALFVIINFMVIHGALKITMQEAPVLVLDKVLGLLLAFVAIPFSQLSIKIVLVGFSAFHVLRSIVPFLTSRLWDYDLYKKFGTFAMIIASLISGVIVNVLLHLMLWTVR